MALTPDEIDLKLKSVVLDELGWTPSIDSPDIQVGVVDGAVTLSGVVSSYPQELLAIEAVRQVCGVAALIDEIIVAEGCPSPGDAHLQQEASDALAGAIGGLKVKATVRQGVITLSGEVLWHHEREAAARAVRYLEGVSVIHNMLVVRDETEPSTPSTDPVVGSAAQP